jgi:hypothetical protein
MDAQTVRTMLLQNLQNSRSDPVFAHEMYHHDAVLEFPQSGERFEGVENFRDWRSTYPASTDFEIREVRGGGDLWVVEVSVSYDGGPRNFGVSIQEFRENKIVRESIYYGEAWDPPEWRAQWRAAPTSGGD